MQPDRTPPARTWSPADAERWLREREPLGMHFGLERMEQLMAALGDPHCAYRSVHVVGTNGKSSTVRMIAAVLERHGVATGTYTSPHLVHFSERVEIRERPLDPARFAARIQRVAGAVALVDAARHVDRVTQFEALTAAAYLEFAVHGVEVAVVEAGLGGRHDATSVIASDVQVLTNVDLEHTALLGTTHHEIAAEKLAVVRDGRTLVIGAALHPDAERLADETAARHGARLVRAAARPRIDAALTAGFQRRNLAVAQAAAEAVLGTLDEQALRAAAAAVRCPGRLEVVGRRPLTVIDAAHNPHGIAALMDALPELVSATSGDGHGLGQLVAVVSILADKDAKGMLEALLPRCTAIVATSNSSTRARTAEDVALLVRELRGPLAGVIPDPRDALAHARALAGHGGVVVASGSICLAGDLLAALGEVGAPSPVSAVLAG